jgi:Lipocalin-like domain
MQPKTKLLLLTSIIIMVVLFACKKEDHPKTKSELLTTGEWKMTSFTVSPPVDLDGDGIVDSDIYSTYDACLKDDYYVFKNNGTMDINEGSTKCNPSDSQVETVNWAFVNGEKEIDIDGDRSTIVELTSTRFHITVPFSNSIGDVVFSK